MSGLGTSRLVETSSNDDLRRSELELDRAIDSLKEIAGTGRTLESGGLNPAEQLNHSALMNIQIDVHAVFGAAKMSMSELAALVPGSTILLDRNAGDPIDIVANGIRIAVGDMVLLEDDNGRFGFRLLEILK